MIRVRVHSDCDYFAGCENMLANFFADDSFVKEFDVSFSYRPSAEYDSGLRARSPRLPKLLPLQVYDFHQISRSADGLPPPLRVIYKAFLRLVLAKYWLMLWNVAAIYRSLGQERIDVLHINNGGFPGAASCLAAGVAARLRGIKTVVHVVNNLPVPYDRPDRWLDWPLDRLAALCATRFVTGSEIARWEMIRVLKLPDSRVRSQPNGIADRAVSEPPASVRRRLGAEGRPLIAVVAVLEERKGHRVLLEALSRLKREGLSPMPMIALGGDGPLRAGLERLARERGLESDVRFLGWEPRHFDLFNAADVVALPSVGFEDFPNVTIEAMGLGKAVVATDVGGVSEQFEDGESGLLIRPGDAAALAGALRRVCGDPALRERLGRAAAERFRLVYTAKASVERYAELYRRMV